MAKYQFGFIGAGNMGGALASAVCKSTDAKKVLLSDADGEKAQMLANRLGCCVGSVEEAATESEFLFLGVKPQHMSGLLATISKAIAARNDRFVLVTMAAGLSMERICQMIGGNYPIIRIMPNTPVLVGAGTVLYAAANGVTKAEIAQFEEALGAAGRIDSIPEALIDAGSAVSGCGPAFVYLFIEALADGGVACGLPRTKALEYAAQTVCGAAVMVLETGKHPGELKDAVCSPGGTTIAGVRTLEEQGFRGAAMDAVIAAYRRNEELK